MTTFYIRTIKENFPDIYNSGTSDGAALKYTVFKDGSTPVNGSIELSSEIFGVFEQISKDNDSYGYPGSRLFTPIGTDGGVRGNPLKSSVGNYNYAKYLFSDVGNYRPLPGDILYADLYPLHNLDISQAGWESRGWTPSNLATFKQEICQWIQSNKVYSGYDYDYDSSSETHVYTYDFGKDDGINLELFEITFTNDPTPGRKYYCVVFFHGNDYDCLETITI